MFHRTRPTAAPWLGALLCGACLTAWADESPIVPQVDPRDVAVPHIPARDIEVGLFIGSYATQNFGTSTVRGVRLGYAITEDFFMQAHYGQTQISDANYRNILPGGLFSQEKEKLSYYNVSVGYNVLPGEVFLGSKRAKPAALYIVAGVGSTRFDDRSRQTIHYGAGFRVHLCDWAAWQIDGRTHNYSMDLLGKQQSTHNLEFSTGVTFIF
ncbi:MAG: hypothetical protein RI907_1384 [Pseudomonadota bacterium]|jgi:outer membrane beta-barrel protein